MRRIAVVTLALPVLAAACAGRKAPPAFEPKGQSKCQVAKSQLKPLIVEWPSADRMDLEAQARKSIILVRYEGCELEVLRGCSAPGLYAWNPATRQDDRVHIRDEDSLYTNIPIHAARFEGTLRSAGELTVSMSMVGRYESSNAKPSPADLQGDCGRVTHAIVSLTAGAFEFYTGTDEGTQAGAGVLGVGAGVESRHEHTTLNRAGRAEACDKATTQDKAPPDGCGAVLRIELIPIQGASNSTPAVTAQPGLVFPTPTGAVPSCAIGTSWDGKQCVAITTSPFCPIGMKWEGSGCVMPYEAYGARGEDGCPHGLTLDPATRNCTEDGGKKCPEGTRFEAGRGCMAGAPLAQRPAAPAPRCPAGMIGLPGGAFVSRGPVVAVAPLCMDAAEVTVDAYKGCIDARKCTADGVTCDGEAAKMANWGVAGRGQHPMNCVSREQAITFCAAQGKRLPSIHEWEWAARGGLEARKYPWGASDPTQGQGCLSLQNTGTCVVGSHPGSDSAQGIHDLQGNVGEWVSDTASGWTHYKGAAWSIAWDKHDLAADYEFSHWPGNKPDRYPYVGIRCVRNP